MFLYHLNLAHGSSYTHVVAGNFSGQNKVEIIVCRNRFLEVLVTGNDGKIYSRCCENLSFRIRAMIIIKMLSKDYVAIASDSGHALILGYDPYRNCFITGFKKKYGIPVCLPDHPGQYIAVSMSGLAICSLMENHVFFGLSSRDKGKEHISISEKKYLMYDLVGVEAAGIKSTFASLEVLIEDEAKHKDPSKFIQYLKIYEADFNDHKVSITKSHPLPDHGNKLVFVPKGNDNPYGVLICYENKLTFKALEEGYKDVTEFIPLRKNDYYSKACHFIVTSSAIHKTLGRVVVLVQSDQGDLFSIVIQYGKENDEKGAKKNNEKGAKKNDEKGAKQNDEKGAKQNNKKGAKQNNKKGAKKNDEKGAKQNDEKGAKQNDEKGAKQNGEKGAKENEEVGTKENEEVGTKENEMATVENEEKRTEESDMATEVYKEKETEESDMVTEVNEEKETKESDMVIEVNKEKGTKESDMVVEENKMVTEENEEKGTKENEMVAEENDMVTEENDMVAEENEMETEEKEMVTEEKEMATEEKEMTTEEKEMATEENEEKGTKENEMIAEESRENEAKLTEENGENGKKVTENVENEEKEKVTEENVEKEEKGTKVTEENVETEEKGTEITVKYVKKKKRKRKKATVKNVESEENGKEVTVANVKKEKNGKKALKMTIIYVDTIPVAAAMSLLDSRRLFVVPEFGDNFLYEIKSLGDETEMVPVEKGTLFIFEARQLKNLRYMSRLESLSPVMQSYVSDVSKNDLKQFIFACGRGPSSTLRLQRFGVKVSTVHPIPIPPLSNAVWCVTAQVSNDHFITYIVVSLTNATMVLTLDKHMDFYTDNAFESKFTTLCCHQCTKDSFIQVYPKGFRYIKEGQVKEHIIMKNSFENEKEILCCALHGIQIAVALVKKEAMYFEVKDVDGKVHFEQMKAKSTFRDNVMCMEFIPLAKKAKYLTVCLTDSLEIYSVNLEEMICLSTYNLDYIPESLGIVTCVEDKDEVNSIINIGFQEGTLQRIALHDAKIISEYTMKLGTKPVKLYVGQIHKNVAVIALSNRAWISFRHHGRMFTFTPLEFDAIEDVAFFSAKCSPNANMLALSNKTLFVVTVSHWESMIVDDVIKLTYTPNLLVVNPDNNYIILSETDRRPPLHKQEDMTPQRALDLSLDPSLASCDPPTKDTRKSLWDSLLRIFDPVKKQTVCKMDLPINETVVSMCLIHLREENSPQYLLVGCKKGVLVKGVKRLSNIYMYEITNNGKSFQLVDTIVLQDVPAAICQAEKYVLIGEGNLLCLYDMDWIAKKLEKRTIQKLQKPILAIWSQKNFFVVETTDELLTYGFIKKKDGVISLEIIHQDRFMRLVTCLCFWDDDIIFVGDRTKISAVLLPYYEGCNEELPTEPYMGLVEDNDSSDNDKPSTSPEHELPVDESAKSFLVEEPPPSQDELSSMLELSSQAGPLNSNPGASFPAGSSTSKPGLSSLAGLSISKPGLYSQAGPSAPKPGLFSQPGPLTSKPGPSSQTGPLSSIPGLYSQPSTSTSKSGLFSQTGLSTAKPGLGLFSQAGPSTSKPGLGLFSQAGPSTSKPGLGLFSQAGPSTSKPGLGLFSQVGPSTSKPGLFSQTGPSTASKPDSSSPAVPSTSSAGQSSQAGPSRSRVGSCPSAQPVDFTYHYKFLRFKESSYTLIQYKIGEYVKSVQKASLIDEGRKLIVYTTMSGAIGVLVPFLTETPHKLFAPLQYLVYQANPLLASEWAEPLHPEGEDIYEQHNDTQVTVDGNRCEVLHRLQRDKQRSIAKELGMPLLEIYQKIEEMRRTVYF